MIALVLCVYIFIHGITNAFLYSKRGADALPTNEHIYLVYERAAVFTGPAVGVIIGSWLGLWYGLLLCAIEEVAGAFLFSWIHNGSYYLMRDRIAGTKRGFKHTSDSSTAVFTFDYAERSRMAYIGGVILVTAYGSIVYLLY